MGLTGQSVQDDNRAQSNTIAVVLILGLVLASTSVVVLFGVSAISETQAELNNKGSETAMSQLDSKASLVALGESGTQQVNLGSANGNNYQVSSNTGWMNISYENKTGTTVITRTRLGAVTTESDDGTRVAYQGGGVWRKGDFGDARVVSQPEFSYRNGTLTLPVVTINNNATVTGTAAVSHNETIKEYPNSTLANPRDNGTVTVEVKSEYHEGWKTYFEESTDGSVNHYPDEQRVNLTLTIEASESFDEKFKDTSESGVSAPSANYTIENKITECESGDCTPLPTTPSEDLSDDVYWSDGDSDIEDVTFDTTDGDIDVVIDGSLNPQGDQDIIGDGNVTYYINESLELKTGSNYDINTDSTSGDPTQLSLFVRGDVNLAGSTTLVGYIYSAGSTLDVRGSTTLEGAAVSNGITYNDGDGNGNDPLDNIDQNLDPSYTLEFDGLPDKTFLHISENSINVTDR